MASTCAHGGQWWPASTVTCHPMQSSPSGPYLQKAKSVPSSSSRLAASFTSNASRASPLVKPRCRGGKGGEGGTEGLGGDAHWVPRGYETCHSLTCTEAASQLVCRGGAHPAGSCTTCTAGQPGWATAAHLCKGQLKVFLLAGRVHIRFDARQQLELHTLAHLRVEVESGLKGGPRCTWRAGTAGNLAAYDPQASCKHTLVLQTDAAALHRNKTERPACLVAALRQLAHVQRALEPALFAAPLGGQADDARLARGLRTAHGGQRGGQHCGMYRAWNTATASNKQAQAGCGAHHVTKLLTTTLRWSSHLG